MLDLTVIILTYNEELHIRRCLENVCPIAKEVYVIDCFSSDQTQEICAEFKNVRVVEHEWPGNQATQFNWALDHLEINTDWVLRLDADEYLQPELIAELNEKLHKYPSTVSALSLPLARAFCGKILKHSIVNDIWIVRIFRNGKARYENRMMDEHLQILEGETIQMHGKFVDDSRITFSSFVSKHNNYSTREAVVLLDYEFSIFNNDIIRDDVKYSEEVTLKRKQKNKYAKMPLFWRSIGYFFYRYVLKLGFLDGKEGFLWDFLQGLWYRMLVDAKIYECKKACGNDKERIKEYIKKEWGIKVN